MKPAPHPTGTEARVCEDIAKRQLVGLKKYGMSVEGNPLTWRQWKEHHYQELLDAAVYSKREMEEAEKLPLKIAEKVTETLFRQAGSTSADSIEVRLKGKGKHFEIPREAFTFAIQQIVASYL